MLAPLQSLVGEDPARHAVQPKKENKKSIEEAFMKGGVDRQKICKQTKINPGSSKCHEGNKAEEVHGE